VREIYKYQSAYNLIQVWEDGAKVGRVLTLDGIIQLTSYDWHRYYEALCIIPYLFTQFAKEVVVLSGGRGYGAEVLLSAFPNIEKVTLIEEDPDLVETVRTFFDYPDSPKVTTITSSIADWVTGHSGEDHQQQKMILADFVTPPSPHSVGLYTMEHFKDVKGMMSDEGVFCVRGVGPYYNPKAAVCLVRTLQEAFGIGWNVYPYSVHLPFYVPNQTGFYLVCKGVMKLQLPVGLRYLNPGSMGAMFTLGNDEVYDGDEVYNGDEVEVSTKENGLYAMLSGGVYTHHVEEWEVEG